MCPPPDRALTDSAIRRFALAQIALAVALAGLAAVLVGIGVAGVWRVARWMLE